MAAKLKSIAKEIDDLQKLKAKLEELQHHLGTGPLDETATPQSSEADIEVTKPTVPRARRPEAARPTKKAAAAGSAKKPRKAKQVKGKGRQKSPTRADRILGLLNEQPRTVSELTKLLAQEHPEHAAPETAVRNTLENSLVAKSLAHRSKQGRSVFYSRPAPEPESGIEAQEPDAVDVNEDVAPAPI
ncbi:helix-turn-helix domain-containing protein [Streptomyces halobius]|uniref:Penicillinase repressor n=1 Tax=Streptomyces halobius TaxID=2879846 RepID=A0ABY4M0W0_9ACTN|nr:hypothetical protein [Streptomyces halobius]UQA91400.1 hypothetical protein K9S39_05460 [Streptomyces halobius]